MPVADYKRRALEQRLAQLLEEHRAANDQLGRTLSDVERIRLKRQIEALESEIDEVDQELKGPQSRADLASISPPASTGEYDLAVVRDLLLRAFTAADFRRLFLYTSHPDLGLLTHEFGEGEGLASMVDTVIEQCKTKDLLPDLLHEVRGANPWMYARYEPRLFG